MKQARTNNMPNIKKKVDIINQESFESNFPSLESSNYTHENEITHNTDLSSSSSSSSIYYIKNKKEDDVNIIPVYKEKREIQSLPPNVVSTIQYTGNLNYGPLYPGSLVLIDHKDNARSLYRKPSINSITDFEGRFISVSYTKNLGHFIIKTSVESNNNNVTYIVENIRDNITIWSRNIKSVSSPDLTHNYAISSTLLHVYIIGGNVLTVLNSRNGSLIRNIPLPIESSSRHYIPTIAGLERSVYTAGISSRDEVFHNNQIPINAGYIAHITSQGVLANLSIIYGNNLHFRGMYHHKAKVYVTGSFDGNLIIENKKIASVCMKEKTSFILCFDGELKLSWWRFLASTMSDFNIIGDITVNNCNEIFTTCRFRNSIAISEMCSLDVDEKIQRDGDAVMLIKIHNSDCFIRVLPIGDSVNSSDYIAIDNDGTNVVIAGFSNIPLMERFNLSYHMFNIAFNKNLEELYYIPMTFVENKNFSRIVSLSDNSIISGGVFRGALVIEPFGLRRVSEKDKGFYVNFDLDFPKLIGVVVAIEKECVGYNYANVDVQFNGYNNSFPFVDVGNNYYIVEDDNKNTSLTTNIDGSFFASAVKDGILLLKGL